MNEILKNGILGLAVGDALGVPVEFMERKQIAKNPVTGMRGGGSHGQPAGTWSDDTSMTLATLDSIRFGVNFEGIMDGFCRWWHEQAYTAGGVIFDMGISVRQALSRYEHGFAPTESGGREEYDNGNGSLMRMLPVAYYAARKMEGAGLEEKLQLVADISSLTHGHIRAQIGCQIYTFIAWALMENPGREAIAKGLADAKAYFETQPRLAEEFGRYGRIFGEGFAALPAEKISGSGYVVSTLEAALWCLLTTGTYAECVLKAVNLGQDTDTVGAVAGSLAGLLYGREAIPEEWLQTLKRRDYIEMLCEAF